ncbi:MAG: DUF418 domain-containing protein [Flavobacteriales bacterium]|nr:DUF418 domain-containing protein [Flavobacteriales bacterium]
MSAPAVERTHLLDALRGFALFGVVFSNYAALAYWLFLTPEEKSALPGSFLDAPMHWIHMVLIDGKFYSIFSMLFGIGFGFFLAKGNDGLLRFYRRMFILLIIGWLHLRYLWNGDILFLYAVLGLLLPLFRTVRDRTLLITATVLLLMPLAIDTLNVMTDDAFDPGAYPRDMADARLEERGLTKLEMRHTVLNGGMHEFMESRKITWLWRMENLLVSNRIPKVFAMFLIGLWVSRRKFFVDPGAHAPLLKRVFLVGFAVGLPGCILIHWAHEHLEELSSPEGLWGTLGYTVGVVPLAMAYASGFALLWTKERWLRLLNVFAPLGRMALTNYLMQTIIAIFLFTGIGFGWGTHVSAITFESLAVGVFILQVLWSQWWLKRFQFGPMEWLWRSLTYGKLMAMRK